MGKVPSSLVQTSGYYEEQLASLHQGGSQGCSLEDAEGEDRPYFWRVRHGLPYFDTLMEELEEIDTIPDFSLTNVVVRWGHHTGQNFEHHD